jgi:hypothetical protein
MKPFKQRERKFSAMSRQNIPVVGLVVLLVILDPPAE